MTDAEISKPAPKERSNSQNSLNSESTKKIIEASKKRELNLKEQNILLQTENEIWKKKYSNLEQNLLSEISKYRQEIKNFSFERDELNWTIKILKRQNFESTNEIELYSNLKRESETKYVNAVNKQKELKIELDQSFEEVTKLNQIILDVKRKNLELNELIEGMSKGYLSEKYDLLKTELEEKNKIINNLIEENENYKKEKASLVFKDLADHNHEINDLNGSLIEDMGLLEKKYNDLKAKYTNSKETNHQLLISLKRSQQQEKIAYDKFKKEKFKNTSNHCKFLDEKDIIAEIVNQHKI